MSCLFLAITLLKISPLPEKQLRIFLSHLSQQSLNMNKADLIDMIVSNKDKSIIDAHDDKLSQEEINNILKMK